MAGGEKKGGCRAGDFIGRGDGEWKDGDLSAGDGSGFGGGKKRNYSCARNIAYPPNGGAVPRSVGGSEDSLMCSA